MARNVEIKAFAPDFMAVSNKAHALSSVAPETIAQTDVFFRTDRGRLKLRFLSPARGELIFYERVDQAGPKMSTYSRYSSDRPAELRDVLAATYGEDVTVEKTRILLRIGRTRVHLDDVRSLGYFVELEVVLEDDETPETAVAEAHRLMDQLGIRHADLIEQAYADLLRDKQRQGNSPHAEAD